MFDGTLKKCIAPFSLLHPHECETPADDDDDAAVPALEHRPAQRAAQAAKKEDTATTSTAAPPTSGGSKRDRRDAKRAAEREKRARRESAAADAAAIAKAIAESEAAMAEDKVESLAPKMTNVDVMVYSGHKNDVFVCSWNPKYPVVATGSAVVWDAVSGECRQQFVFHESPVLDVDWKDDITFASCGADRAVFVCKVGNHEPIRSFVGHKGEINVLRWDPTATYLASCSDDCTAKIWTMESESPLWELVGHSRQIYSLRWAPATARRTSPLLATASFDGTARLWDAVSGACLHVLSAASSLPSLTTPSASDAAGTPGADVWAVAFSPDAALVATATVGRAVRVFRVADGTAVADADLTHFAGGIYDVAWSPAGSRLAVTLSGSN
ncbi:Transducin (beta)-like 1 X-linked receptor 1, partial [Cladochytrium tenue]